MGEKALGGAELFSVDETPIQFNVASVKDVLVVHGPSARRNGVSLRGDG